MKKLNTQEAIGKSKIKGVAQAVVIDRFSGEGWSKNSVQLPSEMALAIYVNRQELVTILCTPTKLNCLVIGFLYTEGIISGIGDMASIRVCEEESLAEVMLINPEYELPKQRTLTSGCGGGTTFKTQGQRVDSDLIAAPKEVLSLMKQLQEQMVLYRLSGGVHASALSDTKNLLVLAEDIGRHNTFDKIQGECLLRELSTRNRLLLSTGRVSSEMLLKAAKMQAPIVVSRHSPTGSAVSLARDLDIALVGHARGSRMSVYSHPERLGCLKN
ncbi:MAG: formate dehydrogenase accessory sulfurtransferase FdhD [candidate division Zixibacteria bacterium]|nr:formate dehydrogenase accessory sulfurtransferase FdhD [candidate division Zixibacteria bacterium]